MATQEVPTLIVSTDPAHSLSDSLGQDVSSGVPVRVKDTEAPLWALEIEPEQARQELRELAQGDGGDKALEMLSSVGLGGLADQLKVRPFSACVHAGSLRSILGLCSLCRSSVNLCFQSYLNAGRLYSPCQECPSSRPRCYAYVMQSQALIGLHGDLSNVTSALLDRIGRNMFASQTIMIAPHASLKSRVVRTIS
jgi:hypothetical protein